MLELTVAEGYEPVKVGGTAASVRHGGRNRKLSAPLQTQPQSREKAGSGVLF